MAGYETGIREPSIEIIGKIMYALDIDANFLWQDEGDFPMQVSYTEMEHTKKYRFITKHSPKGAQTVDIILDNEYAIAYELKRQREAIAQLEQESTTESTPPSNIISIQPYTHVQGRLISYFHSASAGTGVYILGNEAAERISLPDLPEYQNADYAIKVNGNSMEPDYNDGDIVLVSQKSELKHGDVGIFIVNNSAYLKEYGEHELISRNPDVSNIRVHKYDNIVCMGKVIGKLEEPYNIIEN